MGISINGPSGIDTNYIINSLVDLERSRIRRVEQRKVSYESKIQAYTSLQAHVADLGSKAFSLSSLSAFNMYSESSSNEDLVTVSGGTGSTPGAYDVQVFHTARAEKMVSAEGKITDQTASLSSLGIGVGTINVEGVDITLDAEDTIQDLRMKINDAQKADGSSLGVSATVLKASDTDFRLVLTATETGSTGISYKDVSGTTLQDLGIILTADGQKGTTTQQLTSASDINTAFSALVEGDTITYGGKDHDGNDVANTFVKSATNTIDDFLQHVEQSYHGTVTASIDGTTGNLIVTDNIQGGSQLSMTSLNVAGAAHTMNTTSAGDEGGGVLVAGSDAYFSVDGLQLQSSTNTAKDYIQGVTLNLEKAAADEIVKVEISRDMEGLVEKITGLFDSYNSLVQFEKKQTKYGDPEDEESKKGVLAGDMTVGSMVNQFRTIFKKQFDLHGGDFENLTAIGVTTDYNTGEFTIDSDKLKEALQTDFEDVVSLFITSGSSDTAGIAYGRSTSDTGSGIYELEEVDASHVRYRESGGSTWYTSDTRTSDIATFSDGPADGLSLTMPSGTLAAGETATFTFNKGLSTLVKDLSDQLTDSRDGLISMRQESMRRSMDSIDDRILRMEESVERYRERLVRQFANMEQVLSEMQGQSASMFSALGSGMQG